MDTLMQRLEIVINEGVAKTTVYKAFREGGITPTLEIILEQAQATIAEHEAAIQHRLNMLAEPAEA